MGLGLSIARTIVEAHGGSIKAENGPVSGAVFRIAEGAIKREVAGKAVYFCCASCAAYFDAHRDEVLSARGMPSDGV